MESESEESCDVELEVAILDGKTEDKILNGNLIEKKRDLRMVCIDISIVSLIFIFSPLISFLFLAICPTVVVICIPFCFCLPCLVYLSEQHIPKSVPFKIRFFSTLVKVGYILSCAHFYPLWLLEIILSCLQVIMYFYFDIREIISQPKIEIFEFNDGLRTKNGTSRLYVFGEFESDNEEEEEIGETDDEEEGSTQKKKKVKVILFYLHGGAYMIGNPEPLSNFCRGVTKLSEDRDSEIDLKCYSLDYRKAPRWKVDSILRQTHETLKLVLSKHPMVEKVVLAGDSAGGNLTLLLAHYIRDHSYETFDKQDLHLISIYPVLLRIEDVEKYSDLIRSRREYGNWGTIITGRPMGIFERLIFQNDPFQAVAEYNDYDFFTNLHNLPSHFMVTAEYDFLRDDGEIYFNKLVEEVEEEAKDDGDDESSIDRKYFEYRVIEDECHGFNNNFFPIINTDTHEKFYELVLANIEKRFL